MFGIEVKTIWLRIENFFGHFFAFGVEQNIFLRAQAMLFEWGNPISVIMLKNFASHKQSQREKERENVLKYF